MSLIACSRNVDKKSQGRPPARTDRDRVPAAQIAD
jgi:hypothetical protein